jgi:hypothetical protein
MRLNNRTASKLASEESEEDVELIIPKRYVELKVLIKMDKFGRRSLVLVLMFS